MEKQPEKMTPEEKSAAYRAQLLRGNPEEVRKRKEALNTQSETVIVPPKKSNPPAGNPEALEEQRRKLAALYPEKSAERIVTGKVFEEEKPRDGATE